MTTPQFVHNFANPAFMATMAPGCELGSLIQAANRFMEVVPGQDAKGAGAAVTRLREASSYDTVIARVYEDTIKGVGMDVAGFRLAQEKFQDSARPFFDEHIGALARDVASGEAGIPVFRPDGVDIVDAGLRAFGLRRLMDMGLANPTVVRGLVAELEMNLNRNVDGLHELRDDSNMLLGIAGGTSLLISFTGIAKAISGDPLHFPFPALILPIIAFLIFLPVTGVVLKNGFTNLTPAHRRAIGAPLLWDRFGKLIKNERTMKKLQKEYARAFNRVDWTSTVSPGPQPPAVTGGGRV